MTWYITTVSNGNDPCLKTSHAFAGHVIICYAIFNYTVNDGSSVLQPT